VRIYVVGGIAVEDGSAVLRERALPGNQARLALAMLAVEHRRPLSRDELADELWPGELPPSWETALRAVVSKLRGSLDAAGLPRGLVESAFGCYRLRLDGAFLDLDAAVDALHSAESALARGEPAAAAADALVACLICRRPFLAGLYNPWTLSVRDRIRGLPVHARVVLADAHSCAGSHALAARAAATAVELDPYREPLHRRLISARARAGDRLGAARALAAYRERLRAELGVEVAAETVAALRGALDDG
jgi:DNA-binding SARP family transcriptional activator